MELVFKYTQDANVIDAAGRFAETEMEAARDSVKDSHLTSGYPDCSDLPITGWLPEEKYG